MIKIGAIICILALCVPGIFMGIFLHPLFFLILLVLFLIPFVMMGREPQR